MIDVLYRAATKPDISFLAKIRAKNWGTEQYWIDRITGYLNGTSNPQQSLPQRIIYVGCHGEQIIGFIAGHLTRRFNCDGELEWIDVMEEHRRKGIASGLVRCLARWFVEKEAYKICIDPGNDDARTFYRNLGAASLDKHWMYWNDIRRIL